MSDPSRRQLGLRGRLSPLLSDATCQTFLPSQFRPGCMRIALALCLLSSFLCSGRIPHGTQEVGVAQPGGTERTRTERSTVRPLGVSLVRYTQDTDACRIRQIGIASLVSHANFKRLSSSSLDRNALPSCTMAVTPWNSQTGSGKKESWITSSTGGSVRYSAGESGGSTDRWCGRRTSGSTAVRGELC